ncbi:MAG: carbohydrate kinase family protein [Candidatus Hodarchaeaceae archaeon]|nr:carbohydrate kinase family protein [Candidatus Hodarchaeaceae archaeon]
MAAKIVGLGVSSIDEFVLVEEFCRPDDKIWIKDFARQCGGVVANFCVGVARMGVKSGFMGSAGDDPNGHEILQNFKNHDMDVEHFFLKKETKTPVNIIVVDSHGGRQILQDPYMEKNVLKANEIMADYVARADIFHTDAVNIESARKCMRIAKEAGKRVSFDLERHVAVYGLDAIRDLLGMTDILLPNRRGALELTKETDVRRAARKLLGLGPEIVLITLGEGGSLLVTAEGEHRIPIYKVENVVDTTGAGDAFNSAFVSCIYKGMAPLEAADFASAVAALSVTKVGAQSMPRWKEAEEFMASKPERGPVG